MPDRHHLSLDLRDVFSQTEKATTKLYTISFKQLASIVLIAFSRKCNNMIYPSSQCAIEAREITYLRTTQCSRRETDLAVAAVYL
jgi:hypothetical protein